MQIKLEATVSRCENFDERAWGGLADDRLAIKVCIFTRGIEEKNGINSKLSIGIRNHSTFARNSHSAL
jgi:hypothetical protein